jgi:hypothetical protein
MKIKTLLYAGMAFILAGNAAGAADLPVMPVKAPPVFFVDTSGFYWGIEAGAGVQQASASGSPLFANSLVSGKLTASGGTVGGCFGYIKGHAAQWLGLQACVDYQNISAGEVVANQPIGIASRWSSTVEFRYGGTVDPLSMISSTLGGLGIGGITFPTFTPIPPAGVNVEAGPRSYIAAGFEAFGVTGSVGSVNGADVAFAPMLKLGAIWQILDKTTGKPTGNAVDVSAMVSWPMRGFEVTNLGASGGGAPGFTGGLDTGTRYMGKVAFLFPVPR